MEQILSLKSRISILKRSQLKCFSASLSIEEQINLPSLLQLLQAALKKTTEEDQEEKDTVSL